MGLTGTVKAERVSQILNNASQRVGEIVEVDGLVTQLQDANKSNFKDYWLKDKYGGIIMVHTDGTEDPITNKKYNVKGYLTYNADNGLYYISETYRNQLSDDAFIIVEPSNPFTPTPAIPWWKENFLILVIAGGAIILALIIIAFVVSSKKSKSIQNVKPSYTSHMTANSAETKVSISNIETVQNNTEELKTMIIPKADPKTMKFIPGELEILKGADIGKKFKIAGSPQSDGTSIVTIGRENSNESNMFSHIHLKEKTISRQQAQIIQSNGNIKVKNLSKTNLTKVDGKELMPDETIELSPNAIISLGEVEIKYLLN